MTALVWDKTLERQYEIGVDRGVIYASNSRVAVWNGLISVIESEVDDTQITHYYDGIKYVNLRFGGFYRAQVNAYSIPYLVGSVFGEKEHSPGFVLADQMREQFNFCYRTMVGESAYKLHLVYNAIATPKAKTFGSVNDSPEATVLEYQIDAIPPIPTTNHKPSAHLIVDSKKTSPAVLVGLENILYGTVSLAPRFPTQSELITTIYV